MGERSVPNTRYTVRKRNPSQAFTVNESLIPDIHHAVRNRDFLQEITVGKRFFPDPGHRDPLQGIRNVQDFFASCIPGNFSRAVLQEKICVIPAEILPGSGIPGGIFFRERAGNCQAQGQQYSKQFPHLLLLLGGRILYPSGGSQAYNAFQPVFHASFRMQNTEKPDKMSISPRNNNLPFPVLPDAVGASAGAQLRKRFLPGQQARLEGFDHRGGKLLRQFRGFRGGFCGADRSPSETKGDN